MSANENTEFIAVKFTLKGKYDPSETVTFWVTSQPALEELPFPEPHFPLLQSINNVGVEQNEFFPKFTTGSIRISNGRDSLNFSKRFTDLADLFAIQGATIEIYAYCTDVKTGEFIDEGSIVWDGEIQGVTYSPSADRQDRTLNLTIGRTQRDYPVTKQLRLGEFSTLPDRSKNKVLPIVFGQTQQVIPYPIYPQVLPGNPQPGEIRYAYATNLEGSVANRFRNSGITKYLAAEIKRGDNSQDADYYEVTSGSFATQSYGFSGLSVVGTVVNLSSPRAFWIPGFFPGTVTSTSHLVHGILLNLQGNGAGGDPSGELSIRLHRKAYDLQRPSPPSEAIATATINKEDYPAWSAGSPFTVVAHFDRIVPIVGGTAETYWWSIQGSNEDDAASVTHLPVADIAFLAGVPTGLVTHYVTPEPPATTDTTALAKEANKDTWEEELTYGTAGQSSPNVGFFAIQFTDVPGGDGTADAEGLGFSYVDFLFNTFSTTLLPLEDQELLDFDRLDLILEIDGLTDVDGTVTGTPGNLIDTPLTQVDTLLHEYDGTSWQPQSFYDGRFSDSHVQYTDTQQDFYRTTAGRTFSREQNTDIIQSICRNSYSMLVYDGINLQFGYSLYAPGRRRAPVARISDQEGVFERWTVNNLREVINAINMNYARRLDNVHFQHERDQEQFRDYSQSLLMHYRDGGTGQALAANSYTLYGDRRLREEGFDWLNTTISAQNVARLFLSLREHPGEFVLVTVPYCDYRTLQMLDVVTLVSTELPNVWGTNPHPCGVNEEDYCWFAGLPARKSGAFEAEIVAMTFNYQDSAQAELRLLCRVFNFTNDPQVKNYFVPPTGVFT